MYLCTKDTVFWTFGRLIKPRSQCLYSILEERQDHAMGSIRRVEKVQLKQREGLDKERLQLICFKTLC